MPKLRVGKILDLNKFFSKFLRVYFDIINEMTVLSCKPLIGVNALRVIFVSKCKPNTCKDSIQVLRFGRYFVFGMQFLMK